MSLITLDINEVADVIDEAITRHVLVSHNNNKANNFVNDILSFRGDLQKLDEYVRGLNYSSDIESLRSKISELTDRLVTFEQYISDISNHKTDDDVKEIHALSLEIDGLKRVVQDRYIDVAKSTELELIKFQGLLDKLREHIDVTFDNYVTTKESLLLSQEIKEIKDEVQEYFLEEIDGIRLSFESLIKEEINNIPVPINGKDGKDGVSVDFDLIKSFILEEISKIPLPENGKSIDIDVVLAFIKDQIDKIPIPKDGKDGIDGISVNFDDIRAYIDTIPPAKNGEDGKSVDLDVLLTYINDKISEIPVPKDGIGLAGSLIDRDGNLVITCTNGNVNSLGRVVGNNGTSVSIDDVRGIILQEVGKIPIPKDGENGTSVSFDEIKSFILETIDDLPLPKDGKDGASIADIEDFVRVVVEKTVSEIPIPRDGKDGVSVSVDDVKPIVIEAVRSIPLPKDGKDGEIDWGRIEITMNDRIKSTFDKEYRERQNNIPLYTPEEIPENVAEKVAKAISMIAESPYIHHQQQSQPIVVNVTQPTPIATPPIGPKRITTRRDEQGNIIAEVTSVDKTMTIRRNKDGTIDSEES